MKMKKMLAPFLIAGFVLSAGGNATVKASEVNNEVDWEKAWESLETENYPSHIILGEEVSVYNDLWKYTDGNTSLSKSNGKVTSTGYTLGGGLVDVITVQTSISMDGLSSLQGNYDSATVLNTTKTKVTSTISSTDPSGSNKWTGLSYHTLNRASSNITFSGYTSANGEY